jgi:senataxin
VSFWASVPRRTETNVIFVSLHWDYDHDGPEPSDTKLVPSAVPDSFPGGDNAIFHYQEIFEPLILLEAWSALVASKDENPLVLEVEVTLRRHTDTWVDLDVATNQMLPPKWSLTETDIVLLRPVDGVGNVLSKVVKSKRSPEGLVASLRCSLQTDRLRAISSKLSIRSRWRMSRVYRCAPLPTNHLPAVSL